MKSLRIIIPAAVVIICFILIVNNIAREWSALVGCIAAVPLMIQFAHFIQKKLSPPKNKKS